MQSRFVCLQQCFYKGGLRNKRLDGQLTEWNDWSQKDKPSPPFANIIVQHTSELCIFAFKTPPPILCVTVVTCAAVRGKTGRLFRVVDCFEVSEQPLIPMPYICTCNWVAEQHSVFIKDSLFAGRVIECAAETAFKKYYLRVKKNVTFRKLRTHKRWNMTDLWGKEPLSFLWASFKNVLLGFRVLQHCYKCIFAESCIYLEVTTKHCSIQPCGLFWLDERVSWIIWHRLV